MAEPLDLNQLRTFLAVHRSGSFTAAAHLLGLSQSTVTTQIRALETRLGRELFERRARGVAPLPYADDLAAQVASPLDHLSGLSEDADTPVTEPVHLAGPAEFLGAVGMRLAAPLIAAGVQLRVTTGLTDDLLDELRAGRHDLVISTRRPNSRGLVSEPFADEEFVLVAAPVWAERLKDAPLTAALPATLPAAPATVPPAPLPAALADIPLIAYDADLPIIRRYWRYVFNERLTAPAQLTTIPDLRGIRTAVVAGAGWTVLPKYLCRAELDSGALALLHEPDEAPLNTAYLVRRPGGSANPHVAKVRHHLLAAAKAWWADHEC
ncbi:LysR family transcriptional regulator [Catenulispora rubra]|uniref:LysR family transcriptional regulator n=1 Tax=Catenulispora rubra TaxID=280293 RepID=UPI001892528C|nr:LysR family transcriptional regulator [Catenulispora rubra]